VTSSDVREAFRARQLPDEALVATLARLPTGVIVVDRDHTVRYANVAAARLLHSSSLRVGEQLPETPPGRSLRELADRLFAVGLVHEDAIQMGELTVDVGGTIDRHEDLCTIVLDELSGRMRRHRSEEDFVVNASHEILGPIAAIIGAVEVLQDGAKDDPVARDRFLAHIATAAERLASTATALLVLAKAEAGLGAPRLELVPLQPVLDELSRDKQDVSVNCPAKVGVLADSDLLRRAIGVLVENARRHTRDGVRITVDEAGDMVAVNVVDDGTGILPENLERVTDRFFSPDGADSGGYGVGLSIAARAAKVLGGTLELDSDRTGTHARLRLPSARLL